VSGGGVAKRRVSEITVCHCDGRTRKAASKSSFAAYHIAIPCQELEGFEPKFIAGLGNEQAGILISDVDRKDI
jgi:hypothetical protein